MICTNLILQYTRDGQINGVKNDSVRTSSTEVRIQSLKIKKNEHLCNDNHRRDLQQCKGSVVRGINKDNKIVMIGGRLVLIDMPPQYQFQIHLITGMLLGDTIMQCFTT